MRRHKQFIEFFVTLTGSFKSFQRHGHFSQCEIDISSVHLVLGLTDFEFLNQIAAGIEHTHGFVALTERVFHVIMNNAVSVVHIGQLRILFEHVKMLLVLFARFLGILNVGQMFYSELPIKTRSVLET